MLTINQCYLDFVDKILKQGKETYKENKVINDTILEYEKELGLILEEKKEWKIPITL